LNRFGAHNGGAQDSGLLNEKWESMALLESSDPGDSSGDTKTYFLFSLSDNDLITQNGFLDDGKITYKDGSGFNLDNQILAFKVTLPKGAKPLVG
jgi:hypothetical protein